MPAYRSEAEAEIREPVVARLRELMPRCRIIHEIQSACQGRTRIDVLAVTETRIAAVEIKSSRDKLDRLPTQMSEMHGSAHHVIAALHRKHFEITENPKLGLVVRPPKEARYDGQVWGFDLPDGPWSEQYRRHELRSKWDKIRLCLPGGARILWREELREIVSRHALTKASSKLTIPEMLDLMEWNLTGATVTREVCAALRRRQCVEADPAIEVAE